MNRQLYYTQMKALAHDVRSEYGLKTPRVSRGDLRRIYKHLQIDVVYWPPKIDAFRRKLANLRGAYIFDDLGAQVMIARGLPTEPTIFTLCHELKHHLKDQGLEHSLCHGSNVSEEIEIGAEVFAAEMIFPDRDFEDWLSRMHVTKGHCTARDLVKLKYESQTTLSYTAVGKKAVFRGYLTAALLRNTPWKTLEAQMYGEPLYKRLLRARANQPG